MPKRAERSELTVLVFVMLCLYLWLALMYVWAEKSNSSVVKWTFYPDCGVCYRCQVERSPEVNKGKGLRDNLGML